MSRIILFLSTLLIFPFSSHCIDFCIADFKVARTSSGYACKNPASVTIDDFVSSELALAGDTNKSMDTKITPVFVQQLPGLNGLGLSVSRSDVAPGSAIPMNTHHEATEVVYMQSGSVTVGFICSADVAYVKQLKEGDIMIVPRGLLHFLVNTGDMHSTAISFFSDPEPGSQIVTQSLFSNDIASQLLEKSTSIDDEEVKRLKNMFGGTN